MVEASRRAILSGALAIPLAAAIHGASAGAISNAVAAPFPMKLPEHPWRWWVTSDRETYHEGFDTFAEAMEYAKESDYSLVAECQQQDFDLEINGDDILERLSDSNSNFEKVGEGEFLTCTHEQELDLGKMLTETIYAWVAKHNINITAWSFGDVRNETPVPERKSPEVSPSPPVNGAGS